MFVVIRDTKDKTYMFVVRPDTKDKTYMFVVSPDTKDKTYMFVVSRERWSSLDSFLTIVGKFSLIIGTVLYAFGSCERHFKLTEEMYSPLSSIPKADALRRWRFYKLDN